MASATRPDVEMQFVEFSWVGFHPRLLFSIPDSAEVSSWDIERGKDICIDFSGEPACTGIVEGETRRPCPGHRPPEEGLSWCRECARELVPDPRCVFEPRCGGELCPDAFCSVPHAVYLALFGTRAKIGMTSLYRVPERLIEQGADGYMVLAQTDNRRDARRLENDLSRGLRISQTVPRAEKVKLLSARPDVKGMMYKASLVREGVRNLIGAQVHELMFLDGYPLEQPLAGKAAFARDERNIRGELVGLKGPLLIFKDPERGRLIAMDPSEMVGMTACIH
jgi:hypothetical protein